MRIAFVTPEFVTTHPDAGGLASYLSRITRVLRGRGHEVTVITLDPESRCIENYHGVRIVNVTPPPHTWPLPIFAHWRVRRLRASFQDHLRNAWALGSAVAGIERARPFDLIQGSNSGATTLFVPRRHDRPVITRWSSSYRDYVLANGVPFTPDNASVNWLENRCGRRSDIAYAPCQFTADIMTSELGRKVHVIRPPLHTQELAGKADPAALDALPHRLPERFLLHCGRLSRLKGSDLVIDAARQLHESGQAIPLILAGTDNGIREHLAAAHDAGLPRDHMINLGPIDRPALLALMQRSIATLAPSRCDNLPNTVIESLALGVPVIGSDGVSINELVEDGRNGRCVPIGDAAALAQAMREAWNGRGVFSDQARPLPLSQTLREMDPDLSADALMRCAGYADGNDQKRPAA